MPDLDRTALEKAVRDVLIEATDEISPGGEGYVGWSQVLAERVVAAVVVALSSGLLDRLDKAEKEREALRSELARTNAALLGYPNPEDSE